MIQLIACGAVRRTVVSMTVCSHSDPESPCSHLDEAISQLAQLPVRNLRDVAAAWDDDLLSLVIGLTGRDSTLGLIREHAVTVVRTSREGVV